MPSSLPPRVAKPSPRREVSSFRATAGRGPGKTSRGDGHAELTRCLALTIAMLALGAPQSSPDRDSDGEGLSDLHELHQHDTDLVKVETDRGVVPDCDSNERREHACTVLSMVQVLPPVTMDFLCGDDQDARLLEERREYLELVDLRTRALRASRGTARRGKVEGPHASGRPELHARDAGRRCGRAQVRRGRDHERRRFPALGRAATDARGLAGTRQGREVRAARP